MAAAAALLCSCALDEAGQAPSITTATPLAVATVGQAYAVTLAATGATPMVWTLAAGDLPAGLGLDLSTGDLTGVPTSAAEATFTVQATNAFGQARAEFTLVAGSAPSITTLTLPPATSGAAYSHTLNATGTAPLGWALAAGSLPAGLALAADTGVVSGTPTGSGTATFTVTVGNAHGSDARELSLDVQAAGTPPTITAPPSPLPSATLQALYLQGFAATGSAPIHWSISAGSLPPGLVLDANSGVIGGLPTVVGANAFSVTATNAAGSDTRPYQLTVTAGPNLALLAPTTAPCGATVILTGTGFQTLTFVNTVMFGTTPAPVLAASATQLTVEVPHGISGTVAVRVTIGSLGSNALPFDVDPTIVRFVDAGALGFDDGSSWRNAHTSLAAALAAAGGGDEVWVAAGRYLPGSQRTDTFTLPAGVAVFGGFAGIEGQRGQRDPHANQTVLSGDLLGDDSGFTDNGDNVLHVVTASAGSTLDGCTVSGGNADGAGGDADGGGIVVMGIGVTLSGLRLQWNSAGDDGGGIWTTSGGLQCRDCLFADLRSADAGGAVCLAAGAACAFSRCVFTRASASLAAGISTHAQLECRDCLFAANSGFSVGVLLLNADTLVRGCTFFANVATGTRAITTNAACTITDSIFFGGNATLPFVLVGPSASALMTTSDMQGGVAGVTDGGGNIAADPLFLDPFDLDGPDDRFGTRDDGSMLGAGSPCADSGTTAGASASDLTGTARPQGAGVDMGAYER